MTRSYGKRSNIDMLSSSMWTLLQIVILIGGHVLIASHIWLRIQGHDASARVSELTGLPAWAQILAMLATVGLDIWTTLHSRRQRMESRKR